MRDASARPTRSYSFKNQGQSVNSNNFGNHLLKPGCGARVFKPSWADGVTTIRILPQRCPENPAQWDPYRLSGDPGDFGDWLRSYPGVRGFGDPSVTFFMSDQSEGSPDVQMLPPWILYRAIDNAIKAGQEQPGWAAMMKGGAGRGAKLPKPGGIYVVQAAIVQHKGKLLMPPRGIQDDDDTIVMELSSGAGDGIVEICNAPNPNPPAQIQDFSDLFLYGDPISLDRGQYFTIYNLEKGDPRQQQFQQPQMQGGPNQSIANAFGGQQTRFGRQSGGGGNTPRGYGVYAEPTFNGYSADWSPMAQQVANKVKPWDDILYFPTAEEQAALIADKFPADMIMYAFRDYPHWIPQHVRDAAVSRHSALVQGAGGGQFYGGLPQGQVPQGQQPVPMGAGGFMPQPANPQMQQPVPAMSAQPAGYPAPGQAPGYGQPAVAQPMGQQPYQAGPYGAPAAGFGQPAQLARPGSQMGFTPPPVQTPVPGGQYGVPMQQPAVPQQNTFNPNPVPTQQFGQMPMGQPNPGFPQQGPQQFAPQPVGQYPQQQPPAQQFAPQSPQQFAPQPAQQFAPQQPQPQLPMQQAMPPVTQQPWGGNFANTAVGSAPPVTQVPVQDIAMSMPQGGIPNTGAMSPQAMPTAIPGQMAVGQYPQQQPQMQPQPAAGGGDRAAEALQRARANAGRT